MDSGVQSTEKENTENTHLSGINLSLKTILSNSLRTFVSSFILAYGIRTGISVALRAIHLIRTNPKKLFSLNQLISEAHLIVRVDAVRLGLTLSTFTGGFTLLNGLLQKFRKVNDGYNSLIAGFFSGLALAFQEKDSRRTIALYLLTRLLQALYNASKQRGWWHFWGSSWKHGDSLLFILTSAQVMYAYVMRPDSIPLSYFKFISRSGPINPVILEAVKNNNRGLPIDTKKVQEYIHKASRGLSSFKITEFPPIVPCAALHPHNALCTKNVLDVWLSTAKKIFPLYATLTFVPTFVLRTKSLIKNPSSVILNGILSTAQSTSFLASFCAMYQLFVCLWRNVFTKDHRSQYFLAGIFSSLAIFLEKKSRRSELALYVLPRALDSWYIQLYDRKWLGSLPHGEILLFMLSTSGLMYFFHNEPQTISPVLNYVMKIIFRKRVI